MCVAKLERTHRRKKGEIHSKCMFMDTYILAGSHIKIWAASIHVRISGSNILAGRQTARII